MVISVIDRQQATGSLSFTVLASRKCEGG